MLPPALRRQLQSHCTSVGIQFELHSVSSSAAALRGLRCCAAVVMPKIPRNFKQFANSENTNLHKAKNKSNNKNKLMKHFQKWNHLERGPPTLLLPIQTGTGTGMWNRQMRRETVLPVVDQREKRKRKHKQRQWEVKREGERKRWSRQRKEEEERGV